MELASVLSELLKLLLGTSGLGDLEHTEGRCLTLGPALARVMMLPVSTSLKREQVHRHIHAVLLKGTVHKDGPEMMLTDASGPLHLHLNHHIL